MKLATGEGREKREHPINMDLHDYVTGKGTI